MALYILTIRPNLGFRYIRLYDTVTLTQSRLDLQSHQNHVLDISTNMTNIAAV